MQQQSELCELFETPKTHSSVGHYVKLGGFVFTYLWLI
jgi:hypothetical protein